MIRIWINLSNGLEALSTVQVDGFLRIQSTYCEQKHWARLLDTLDTTFLLQLALGDSCYIMDTSPKREVPRAIWQGIPFIQFVLGRIWYGKSAIPEKGFPGKGPRDNPKAFEPYFTYIQALLPSPTLARLAYFRRFLLGKGLFLTGISWKGLSDGRADLHRKLLLKYKEKMGEQRNNNMPLWAERQEGEILCMYE